MENNNTIGLEDALKYAIDKLESVRVPLGDRQLIDSLNDVEYILMQCVKAYNEKNSEPTEEQGSEVTDDV